MSGWKKIALMWVKPFNCILMDKLNIDPAIATGLFVTTSIDILGISIYFFIARWLLGA